MSVLTGVVTYADESDFDRAARATREPLPNSTDGLGVGLKGSRLVILAAVVESPSSS